MVKAAGLPSKAHLTLEQYQERARKANQFRDSPEALDQLQFGFFGEIGGLLAAVKKAHRDFGAAEQASVKEELGDALWYLSMVADESGLTLEAVGVHCVEELKRRFHFTQAHQPVQLTFHELDGLMAFSEKQLLQHTATFDLRQLAARAGQFLASGPSSADLLTPATSEHLGTLLSDMIIVGALFKLRIEDIALANLDKFEARWPPEGAPYSPLFDETYPAIEQFSREFSIMFIERETARGEPYVLQQLNGVNIGDRLTDNRSQGDGYRFHDVFHLAYIAHLGWSPVARGLLKLKRKSDPDVDQNQDGARAQIIEEGIATWIFNHAQRRNFFEGVKPGRLEYSLLKQVIDMVDGYEVARCPMWQWERAILEGFRVFRELVRARGGVVTVDLNNHAIEFTKLDRAVETDVPQRSQPAVTVGSARPPTLAKP